MNRSKARIAALEQGSSELSTSAAKLLVSLLGRFDALWWPFRTNSGTYRAEVRRCQLEYRSGSGCLAARAQGESNWKNAHHARNSLIASGLVDAQVDGGQVVGLRLTAHGISDARAMVGERLKSINHPITQMLFEKLRTFAGCEHSGKWMIENNLLGEEIVKGADPSKWEFAIDFLLPLLRCGAIDSTSDSWSRCYFLAVVDAELPSDPPSDRQVETWADATYLRAFDGERLALQRSECVDGGLFIPMRCT